MAYFLFLLVNIALFIRPGEIIPALLGLEIYFYLIAACFAFALPDVIRYLSARSLEAQPITLCVLGILAAVVIQPLVTLDIESVWFAGFLFFKVVVYFLLLVSLVNTPARLQRLLACLVACTFVLTALTVLQFHNVITLSTFKPLVDSDTDAYGATSFFLRLQGTGIFQDPNELGVMLAAMAPLALYLLLYDRIAILRFFWLACLVLFAYGIYLTHSRGALIAFVGGLGVCCWSKLGWQRSVAVGAVGLPILLLLYGGRQTDISANTATGQTRIQLWSDWLQEFRSSPVFGRGMSPGKEEVAPKDPKDKVPGESSRHLAHNSYLQAFADLGFPGGCLFLGMYLVALTEAYRVGRGSVILDDSQRVLQPFLLAAVAAYALGMLTLSLCYSIPTYMIPGLAVALGQSTACWPPTKQVRLDQVLLGRFALAGCVFLAAIYVIVRLFINWA